MSAAVSRLSILGGLPRPEISKAKRRAHESVSMRNDDASLRPRVRIMKAPFVARGSNSLFYLHLFQIRVSWVATVARAR